MNSRRSEESSMLFYCIWPTLLLMTSLLCNGSGTDAATTAGGSTGCASCGTPPLEKESEERLMVEIAKQHILKKLHLKERPNITHTVPRAALLTALRKLHAGRVRPDGTLELENSSTYTKDLGYEIVSFADFDDLGSSATSQPGLTFQFLQQQGQRLQVLQSSLWLYVRSSQTPHSEARVSAQVFLSGEGASNRTLVLQKLLEVQKGNWHTFPLTQTLQAFLDRGQGHLRLEVTCDEDGRNLCSLGGAADALHQPFLVAQVRLRDDESKHVLSKRSLRCGEDSSICCKKDFYIKFKDIQWQDWIIAPEGYHMNYCMGQCPQLYSGSPGIASSLHATVFSQLKANGINTAVSSCCVPIKRAPLSMVYFDTQHSIVKKDMPDMIVEACGCT
ncbi:inhibin beta B chain [Osmerus mordax]|uniref:inhibin beta B chain n=1 Tax=Osmerus mordax TaxID=8014 RepID=UPI00350F1287